MLREKQPYFCFRESKPLLFIGGICLFIGFLLLRNGWPCEELMALWCFFSLFAIIPGVVLISLGFLLSKRVLPLVLILILLFYIFLSFFFGR